MYSGSPKHPIFSGSTFGLMSGEEPMYKPQVEGGHEALGRHLQQMGLHFEETHGKYQKPERSYIIHNPTLEQMQHLGKLFGQESVIHSQNGQHKLVYTNGEHEGHAHHAEAQTPIEHFEQPPDDFYTAIPGQGYFRINLDWNQKHPLNPINKSELAKGDVVPLNPSAPTGKKFRAKAQVVPLATAANTRYEGEKQVVDPEARNRAMRSSIPETAEPVLSVRGVGQGKNVYDYSHLLSPESQALGHRMYVKHSLGQHDDYMHAEILDQQGNRVNSGFAYPRAGIGTHQPPGGISRALQAHANWILYHDKTQKSEREFTVEQATYLAKNAVAQLLAQQAPKALRAHPHNYDWHDGHTDHHQRDLAGPQLPGLMKAGEAHPHMDTPPVAPAHSTNEQAAPVGVSTYKQFALPYGNVQPGQASDLLHYKYHGKLPEIEKLVADHGFKTYYAGGKYGKPDLANKNYNTGHLMVYDPSTASGGDFGHEEYTRGWRQIHELAHALTYPELNKIYGEGRRMGKLGVHRTMNEALRAVHWEWLAAHKQRELSEQVGVHLSDQDFHKELNTVMHDAAHRAVTGKFTEPGGEGFVPHSHHVPLHTALQMVRDAGHQMGLQGLHDTVKKPLQKNLPGTPPAAAPQLHNSVENFMSGLKALPKGDPSRGRFITQHMHHAPFLESLKAHPQGKQIHAMLTNHLNSVANAGPKVGAKVTMKSEGSDPIYSSAEGENPVADEKTYTIEEAREVLLKNTREKISAYAKEIEALRERELKKAVIQPHKHNQGLQAASAAEDVPPSKLNPKGIDKKLDKNFPTSAPATSVASTSPGTSMAMAEKAEALCKKCGKSHDMQKGCGEMEKAGLDGTKIPPPTGGPEGDWREAQEAKAKEVKKADLVSEKGKRTDNHTVAGSKLPDDAKPKQVNEGTSKNPGSGGIKLPGSNLKKSELRKNAAPPTAKPPSGKNMGTAVPTSAPKAPAMKSEPIAKEVDKVVVPGTKASPAPKGAEYESKQQGSDAVYQAKKPSLEKAGLPAAPKAQMQQHAMIAGSKAAAGAPAGAPAPAPKMPTPAQHADRAAGFQAAMGGAFQPQPAAGGVKLPGAGLGLKSPKAAGVTRGAMGAAPKPVSAGPVVNAARPAAAKPGIFGKLFGKAEEKPEAPKPPDKATQTLFEDPEPKVLHPSDKKKGGKK